MIGNDTLLVSVDFSGEDTGVLVVGRKEKNQAIKIVNALPEPTLTRCTNAL